MFCNIDISYISLCNKSQQKQITMTTFQKTLEIYKKGQKSLAYLAFINDPSANKNVSFEKFCKEFDRIIKSK
jgi:hypothetical protein